MRRREDSQTGAETGSSLLNPWERFAAAMAALLFLVLAVWLYSNPPDHTTALAGCTASDTGDCVVTVDADPGTLTTALIAAGGVLSFVAVLGRRFSSIKLPGIAELSAPRASEVRKETPAAEAADGRVQRVVARRTGVGGETASSLWGELPTWARSALYRWAADNPIFDIPISEAIAELFEPRREESHPWYVTLRDPSGEERTLRVATDRGSSQGAQGT